MAQVRDSLDQPWKGVNLGGWLLLEPGPSYPLFMQHPLKDKSEARCEWDIMKGLAAKMGKMGAAEVVRSHRETHTTKADFQRVRSCGLNSVRLPFGYWVVTEPRPKEPYVGPALDYIDRAVSWAEEFNLQIVLDLHGCPGGESPEAPCGRRQRPESRWHWSHWDFQASLKVLQILAQRYAQRSCVTGIAVCNEPSGEVPAKALISYYSKAVDVIRKAGMDAQRVAVVLPVFQRPEGEEGFIQKWAKSTKGKHRNVCFDVHCYHCFENQFHGKTFAEQLRAVEANTEMFKLYPMVAGEWSLGLGQATWCTCGDLDEDTVLSIFGVQQQEAFKGASHGSFFWNWKEDPDNKEWHFQHAWDLGLFSRSPLPLPPWDRQGEDPLEELLHPSPEDPVVYYGDVVYLRVFHGRYIEVQGKAAGALVVKVDCNWSDKGEWQAGAADLFPAIVQILNQELCKQHRASIEFSFCPSGEGDAGLKDLSDPCWSAESMQSHCACRVLANHSSAQEKAKRPVRHRDILRIRARSGSFLAVPRDAASGALALAQVEQVTATRSKTCKEADFEVILHESNVLKHRGLAPAPQVVRTREKMGFLELGQDKVWGPLKACPLESPIALLQNRRWPRYFFSRATATTLDADEDEMGIRARWADFGDWQAFAVERPLELQRRVALGNFAVEEAPRRRQRGPMKVATDCEMPGALKRKAVELESAPDE
ncbi:exgA [Symbiodinium natans]|uniref:glucan 1,3-beta-glucosidase n=1 Tax=Symbiodinium natans TaxID=878477 RepID=A0A812KRC9_9DINO|nr:exgA [Symbiodinium natans]